MSITLNHTIVPAKDKDAAARFFARIFGLNYDGPMSHFAPVRVNEELTLDFDTADSFEPHHYAFHVSDDEFDAIFQRVQEAGIPWGSDPRSAANRQLNSRKGGRGVYFHDLDGHLLELLTRD
jgi:catechol 2,3-dioxygenase-like lactoylglutathione lyase family enzyme